MLRSLFLAGVRNLRESALDLDAGLNLIQGPNAAGKTSVLEAAHILGRGSSFRGRSLAQVCNPDCASMLVAGQVRGPTEEARLAVEWSGLGLRHRYAGAELARRLDLLEVLPLQFIDTDCHEVVSGPPMRRRRLLDWAMFHVEPAYVRAWQGYRRALRQRNALLRSDRMAGAALDAWTAPLVEEGLRLEAARRGYISELGTVVGRMAATRGFGQGLRLEYAPGYARGTDLESALGAGVDRDRAYGATQVGPHRADLRVVIERGDAGQWLSRGQQKLLALVLFLGQVELFRRRRKDRLLLLVDDYSAELDEENERWLLEEMRRTGVQGLLTRIDRPPKGIAEAFARGFHVEQGRLSAMV